MFWSLPVLHALRLGTKHPMEWYVMDTDMLLPMRVCDINANNIDEHLRFVRNLRGMVYSHPNDGWLIRQACSSLRSKRLIELINVLYEICLKRPTLTAPISRHLLNWECLVSAKIEHLPTETMDRLILMLGVYKSTHGSLTPNYFFGKKLENRLKDARHFLPDTWQQFSSNLRLSPAEGNWEVFTLEWDWDRKDSWNFTTKQSCYLRRWRPFELWLVPFSKTSLADRHDQVKLVDVLSRMVSLVGTYTACRHNYPEWQLPLLWNQVGKAISDRLKKEHNDMLIWILTLMHTLSTYLRNDDMDIDDAFGVLAEMNSIPVKLLTVEEDMSATRKARRLASRLSAHLWIHPEETSIVDAFLTETLNLTDPLGNPAISYHDAVLLAVSLYDHGGEGWHTFLKWIRVHSEYETALMFLPENPIQDLQQFSQTSRFTPMITALDHGTRMPVWLKDDGDLLQSLGEEYLGNQMEPILGWQEHRSMTKSVLVQFLESCCRLDAKGEWRSKDPVMSDSDQDVLWNLILLHWHLRLPFGARLSWNLLRHFEPLIREFDERENLTNDERMQLIFGHFFINC